MTTPPQKLKILLQSGVCLQLRSVDGQSLGMIEYVEAMRRASRNEIEGVCTSHGKVRYVRELSASMRSLMREVEDESAGFSADGRSRAGGSINSVTNLGAYRQHLEVGAVWALCLCRGVA